MTHNTPVVLFSMTLWACQGPASTPGQQIQSILNGEVTTDYPTVGEVLINDDPVKQQSDDLCTGTLVGSKTVLTAAHCLVQSTAARTPFRLAGTRYYPASLHPHPDWDPRNPQLDPDVAKYLNDIGLMILEQQPSVAPSPVVASAPTSGMAIEIVGYGVSEANNIQTAGTKRMGHKQIDVVDDNHFTVSGADGNSAKGDSGGPVFRTISGKPVQIGVVSASDTSTYDTALDVRVDRYQDWLRTTSGNDVVFQSSECQAGNCGTPEPQVSIVEPEEGATVSTRVSVVVAVVDTSDLARVECWVGSALQQVLTESPYRCDVDLSEGTQTIRVVARTKAGGRDEAQISVIATEDGAGAGNDGGASTDADTAAGDGGGGCIAAGERPAEGTLAWLMLLAWIGRESRKLRALVTTRRVRD